MSLTIKTSPLSETFLFYDTLIDTKNWYLNNNRNFTFILKPHANENDL
jgi:hypothetical protein